MRVDQLYQISCVPVTRRTLGMGGMGQGVSFVLLAFLAGAPVAAHDLSFAPAATEACLAGTTNQGEIRRCVGRSANTCMAETNGGDTTVGMSGCLEQEYKYWDDRLNMAYTELMGSAKRSDEVMKDLGTVNPSSQATALREMQRAWIGFRDAACGYEFALWGGGTGGGPAILQCLMLETGWQSLRLEARLAQFVKKG